MRRPSLKRQIKLAIDAQLKIGQSKYHAKKELRRLHQPGQRWLDGIYSIETAQNTRKLSIAFSEWIKVSHGCRWLDECRQYATEYLVFREGQGDSPNTLKNRRAALRRLYNDPTVANDYQAPKRRRQDIKRSRYAAIRDAHFSTERNKDLVVFCLGTGLRRHEVAAVRPEDVFREGDKVYIFVAQGKGGKKRTVQAWGPYSDNIWSIARARDGQERIFERVHSHADIQALRRQFAQAKYLEEAHQTFDIKNYNKEALSEVSIQLGHGPKRRDVILRGYVR